MTESELLQILARGEDSRHQFKRDLANPDGVAAELAARPIEGAAQSSSVWPMTVASAGWMLPPCGV